MRKSIQLPILIIMISVFNFVIGMDELKQPLLKKDATDQFVEDGTTEEEDMEKAMNTGKTFFWREMMTNWHCKNGKLKKPEEIGIKKPYKAFVEFCEKWKMMATAANAFVKSWDRSRKENKNTLKLGTSSSRSSRKTSKYGEMENPLECLCLKPLFRVGHRELQMSSAMEAIKAVYRDLFKWGEGKRMEIELKLANDKPWKVIQFLVDHSNIKEIKTTLTELEKSPAVGTKKFDDFMTKNFPKINLNVSARDIFSSAIFAVINVEISAKIDEEEQKCDQFVESIFKLFDQLENVDILTRKELQKDAFKTYIELWEISKELGLDMTKICEADREFAEYANASMFYLPWYLFKTKVVRTKDILVAQVNGHLLLYRTIEQMVGNWHYQFKALMEEEWHNANAEENANANNDEEDAQLEQQLPNPCEEAKLRVKK